MVILKVGIITFHKSHNCGSILQAFALQTILSRLGHDVRIINFSNKGQQRLYSIMAKPTSLKAIIKNAVLLPYRSGLEKNFDSYERFIRNHLYVDGAVVRDANLLSDFGFDCIVAGSDQIWNITIADGDDAYFLPWVKSAKKVAYAPSFGAKNIARFADDPSFYASCIKSFDALSIRENNGRVWIEDLTGLDVPVVLDPTLLLAAQDYDSLEDDSLVLPDEYIFYYSPGYSFDINELVKRVGRRYNLPVIAFNAKAFYLKGMGLVSDFRLPSTESPAAYLTLIKNARAVFTTSFHGTIFSSLYRKTFWTIKNGGMFGDDDRVLTLMNTLGLEDRLIPIEYDDGFDYLSSPDYSSFEGNLAVPRARSLAFLADAIS